MRDPTFLAKKDKENIRKGLGRGTLHTVQILTHGHLDFYAVNCEQAALASQLLAFSVDSILGVKYYLLLVLRSQVFEYLR